MKRIIGLVVCAAFAQISGVTITNVGTNVCTYHSVWSEPRARRYYKINPGEVVRLGDTGVLILNSVIIHGGHWDDFVTISFADLNDSFTVDCTEGGRPVLRRIYNPNEN